MSLDTLKTKVGELIEMAKRGGGEDDFIGVKYSNYATDATFYFPKTADASSLDKVLDLKGYQYLQPRDNALNYMFANRNANYGYFNLLEEAYLPSKVDTARYTFDYCVNLTTIHGDLSNIYATEYTFRKCVKLDANALLRRMTRLTYLGAGTFQDCTQITELKFPFKISTILGNAFNGCTNVTDVFCPWGESEVANAPWGMKNAQIHYNTTYDENGNPIV